MESIVLFFNMIIGEINKMPQTIDNYFERAVAWLSVAFFDIVRQLLNFVAEIATSIISTIGLGDLMNQAWGSINSDILLVLNYCQVPQAINIILSAFIVRFILGMVPFL